MGSTNAVHGFNYYRLALLITNMTHAKRFVQITFIFKCFNTTNYLKKR